MWTLLRCHIFIKLDQFIKLWSTFDWQLLLSINCIIYLTILVYFNFCRIWLQQIMIDNHSFVICFMWWCFATVLCLLWGKYNKCDQFHLTFCHIINRLCDENWAIVMRFGIPKKTFVTRNNFIMTNQFVNARTFCEDILSQTFEFLWENWSIVMKFLVSGNYFCDEMVHVQMIFVTRNNFIMINQFVTINNFCEDILSQMFQLFVRKLINCDELSDVRELLLWWKTRFLW